MVRNGKLNKKQLRVRRVVDVPLREVSGICLRRSQNGRSSLIAVGDRAAEIAWFSQPRSDRARIEWHTSDLSKLSGSMLPRHDSQIEAVCADGVGRVLLLQETPARVELIDPKALKVIDLSCCGRTRRNCASVVTPEGVAGRRNGATARRAFAYRQGEEAGGVHRVWPAAFAIAGLRPRRRIGGRQTMADQKRAPQIRCSRNLAPRQKTGQNLRRFQ